LAPLSSALFLAIANASRLGVPFYNAFAITSTPSGPKPQLLIKNIFKEFAYSKKTAKDFAPNTFTALFEKSHEIIYFYMNELDRRRIESGTSSFFLPTKTSL